MGAGLHINNLEGFKTPLLAHGIVFSTEIFFFSSCNHGKPEQGEE